MSRSNYKNDVIERISKGFIFKNYDTNTKDTLNIKNLKNDHI